MNGKRILITGSRGMLGSCLVNNFSNAVGYSSSKLDITNALQVNQVLAIEKPDIIIHTAAFTNVEACEVEIDKAFKVNTIGTQNLVNYCIDKDVLTIHHKSKYEAERIVEKHINKHLILRTGWIFGGSTLHKKNFVHQRYLEANNNSLIYSDNSQIGNPTYVLDLVEQIKVLINANQFGLYNCVNYAKGISRYDYVKKIIELFSLDCKVEMAPKGMFERLAPVSHNESASNFKLDLLNLNCMGSWDDALSRYVEFLKLNKINA